MFAIFENLSFWFCHIWKSQFLIIQTILKISFKFGFCHFVGAFFLRKNFAVSQPDVSRFWKKNVYSSIVISSYEYGSCVTLGAFFCFRGAIILVRKKGKNVKKSAGCHWILIFLCDSYLLMSRVVSVAKWIFVM